MTTDLTTPNLTGLTLDELAEMANTFAEKCQQSAKKTVQDAATSGRALAAARVEVGDQEFSAWLRAHFDYSRATAYTYMRVQEAVKRFTGPESPTSIRQAIGMIAAESAAEDTPAETPRSERKPATVKVSTPQPYQSIAVVTVENQDDDPAPDPPTTRKTTAKTRKKPEAEKAKTQPVVAEIVEDDRTLPTVDIGLDAATRMKFAVRELRQVAEDIPPSLQKATARELRKLADKLDPPTKFVPPTEEEVEEYCRQRGNGIDAEAFVATGRANGWRLKNGNKMQDWKATIITWEKNEKRFSNNGRMNGNGKTHADNVAAKAARLAELFGSQ